MSNRVIPVAELVLYINGAPFGIVTAFSWQSNTPRKSIRCIDIAEPIELAVGPVSVSGNMAVVRLHGTTLESMGVKAQLEDQSREKYISILVIDRATQMPIFKADSATITSQQWQAAARGIVQGNITFEALSWEA